MVAAVGDGRGLTCSTYVHVSSAASPRVRRADPRRSLRRRGRFALSDFAASAPTAATTDDLPSAWLQSPRSRRGCRNPHIDADLPVARVWIGAEPFPQSLGETVVETRRLRVEVSLRHGGPSSGNGIVMVVLPPSVVWPLPHSSRDHRQASDALSGLLPVYRGQTRRLIRRHVNVMTNWPSVRASALHRTIKRSCDPCGIGFLVLPSHPADGIRRPL